MHSSAFFALAATLAATVAAVPQGFNYASTNSDGSGKTYDNFKTEFQNAKGLAGTDSAFTSARLYTTIQQGTTNSMISAIKAAVDTHTSLLLGMWASAGETAIDNEIAALQSAISTYGLSFTNLVEGISVGSEDLYRISPTGIINKAGIGASPDDVAGYINKVKSAIKNTPLQHAPVGHVDTWTAWVNSSNSAVIDASDFIGMDAYPYFQTTMSNSIDNGKSLFLSALDQTLAAVGSKPVWVTETGWPVSGPTSNEAVASTSNAQRYWDEVGCPLFGKTPTFWYTVQDSFPTTPSPSFGIIDASSTTPKYNLSCSNETSSLSTSASSSKTSSGSASSSTDDSGSPGIGNGGGLGGSISGSSVVTMSGSNGTYTTTVAVGPGATGTGTGTGAGPTTAAAGSGTGAGGKTGPTPTSAGSAPSSTFSGAAVANAGSMFAAVGALAAVVVAL